MLVIGKRSSPTWMGGLSSEARPRTGDNSREAMITS
jgi:hypothetical protein